MVEILPEYMGYDRTIAVFSPDGRLFQVEYAKEAVKRAPTALGLVFRDGVILAAVKLEGELLDPTTEGKISQIDDHVGVVSSGLLADARILINQARIRAQIHRITYEEPIDIWGISKIIGDRMQLSTLYAGFRPYGVTLLIGGVDSSGSHLIESDPSGMLYGWFAYAIGRGASLGNKILKKRWERNLDEKEALKIALEVLDKTEKDKKVDVAIIKKGERFRRLKEEEIRKYES